MAIDHKAVSCIVAEKFPKLNACFTPNSNVARARVYFRAEGGTSWYYVDMKSDAPCMSGILPKPRKEMIDKHVDYYVHATDKAFTEARTVEYDPLVVESEGDVQGQAHRGCGLSKASVQVFPSPAGRVRGGWRRRGRRGRRCRRRWRPPLAGSTRRPRTATTRRRRPRPPRT